MAAYVLRRCLLMGPTALGGMLALFGIFRILPGDPALVMLSGGEGAGVNQEAYIALRKALHLDEPFYVQFVIWLSEVLRGDLGVSYHTGHSVAFEIIVRLPTTVTLMAMAVLITVLLSIPMGLIAAARHDTVVDYALRAIGLTGLSMPSFWVGILVVLILTSVWRWYPPTSYTQPYENPWLSLQQLAFPALVLGVRPVGVALRILRSSVLEELRQDYVRTALAKGVGNYVVAVRHVLPNSFLPTLTYFGLEATGMLAGSVVVESIFNVPGMGQLLIQALQRRDFPLVQGILLIVLSLVMVTNLMVDVLYSVFDPRIRY